MRLEISMIIEMDDDEYENKEGAREALLDLLREVDISIEDFDVTQLDQ